MSKGCAVASVTGDRGEVLYTVITGQNQQDHARLVDFLMQQKRRGIETAPPPPPSQPIDSSSEEDDDDTPPQLIYSSDEEANSTEEDEDEAAVTLDAERATTALLVSEVFSPHRYVTRGLARVVQVTRATIVGVARGEFQRMNMFPPQRQFGYAAAAAVQSYTDDVALVTHAIWVSSNREFFRVIGMLAAEMSLRIRCERERIARSYDILSCGDGDIPLDEEGME